MELEAGVQLLPETTALHVCVSGIIMFITNERVAEIYISDQQTHIFCLHVCMILDFNLQSTWPPVSEVNNFEL